MLLTYLIFLSYQVSTALLPHPCSSPRGQFIWQDLSVVDWSRGDLREILEQEQSQ